MIWAILALLGVPLWLCALGILALVLRSRALRNRPGNIPVRVLRTGRTRWTRAQGVWISNVFAWRGSPAAWSEDLQAVKGVRRRSADPDERKKLRRLDGEPALVVLSTADGETLTVAASAEHAAALPGPFAAEDSPGITPTDRPAPPAVAAQPEPNAP